MLWQPFVTPIALRPEKDRPHKNLPEGEAETDVSKKLKDDERWYVCRQCHQRIAKINDRIRIQGTHQHTFANPSGIVFGIICFGTARGYAFVGPPSTDFTWFAGHSWRITICAACLTHVGWYFSAQDGKGFFGFITDRLLLKSTPKE